MLFFFLSLACATDESFDTGSETAPAHEQAPQGTSAKKKLWFFDGDGDKWGISTSTKLAFVKPAGYAKFPGDCDDTSITVHPLATESCNGIDDDCDGTVDEGLFTTFYLDADGDGYGDLFSPASACAVPAGYVSDSTDCDDNDATIYPGGTDVWYDGQDGNCDQASDFDQDGDGYDADMFGGTDCDDTNTAFNPGVPDPAGDSVDWNCDNQD